ncbi:hypothetical protein SNEBB_002893 [Seison nebaliae]|nr:hypothetical protein SNEBB_002893 [Seison nebaliae]
MKTFIPILFVTLFLVTFHDIACQNNTVVTAANTPTLHVEQPNNNNNATQIVPTKNVGETVKETVKETKEEIKDKFNKEIEVHSGSNRILPILSYSFLLSLIFLF